MINRLEKQKNEVLYQNLPAKTRAAFEAKYGYTMFNAFYSMHSWVSLLHMAGLMTDEIQIELMPYLYADDVNDYVADE